MHRRGCDVAEVHIFASHHQPRKRLTSLLPEYPCRVSPPTDFQSSASPGKEDILDEALTFFRANVLFRKFEVKGSSDKLLVYLTLFVSLCLKKLENCKSDAEGVKVLIMMGLDKFALPGEPSFPLNALFAPAQTKEEAGKSHAGRVWVRRRKVKLVVFLVSALTIHGAS
jgi:hypothetical protein